VTESELQIQNPHILGVFVPELVVWATRVCALLVESDALRISYRFVLKYIILQGVPLPTKPGISLIILTPMMIMQRNLNRSTFVV
jgi:hypothetical protein